MTCVKCKKDIPNGSVWCCWCGKKQTAEKAKRAKRANGTGCVYKRGSSWYTSATVGTDPAGRPIRRRKGGFRTRKEALAYLEEQRFRPSEVRTVSALYDSIQPHLEKLSRDKQTHYRTAWARLAPIHAVSAADLSITDLQNVMDAAVSTYYPAKDIRDLLSLIFERGIAEEVLTVNKARYLVLPDLVEKNTEPFTAAEVSALWSDYQSGQRWTGFCLLMIYTGMMPGELRRLTVRQVDLDRRRITGVGLKTETRKETPIVLPEIIVPVLEDLLDGLSPEDRVCRQDENAFYAAFAEMKKRTGCRPIKELRPYSCRHTLATTLADENVSAAIIKEIMRHAKITTTQRYVHPDQGLYADRMNAALKRPEP